MTCLTKANCKHCLCTLRIWWKKASGSFFVIVLLSSGPLEISILQNPWLVKNITFCRKYRKVFKWFLNKQWDHFQFSVFSHRSEYIDIISSEHIANHLTPPPPAWSGAAHQQCYIVYSTYYKWLPLWPLLIILFVLQVRIVEVRLFSHLKNNRRRHAITSQEKNGWMAVPVKAVSLNIMHHFSMFMLKNQDSSISFTGLEACM